MIYFIIPVLIIALIPLSYIVFLMVYEYKPKRVEEAIMINAKNDILPNEFSVTTFNLGYCSLI